MKKIILLSVFSFINFFSPNLFASQPTYLCKADHAAGFVMNQRSGWTGFNERDGTEFRVHFDERFGLEAEIKSKSGWTQWTPMKEHSSAYWTDDGSLGFNKFTFATRNLRFYAAYTGGYLNGTDKTTWAVVGDCRKM